MTIPTLMSQIRWIVLKQQYKEAVSTMNQALKLVYEKNDTIYDCYYIESTGYNQGLADPAQCTALYEELKTVLKVSHICENQAYKNGCIPNYKGLDKVYEDNNDGNELSDEMKGGCAGFLTNNILNSNPAWVLADGTIIGFYNPLPTTYPKIFFIDINGNKKPNKWGYDIFAFMIMSDKSGSKLYIKQSGCSYREKGGKTGLQMLQ